MKVKIFTLMFLFTIQSAVASSEKSCESSPGALIIAHGSHHNETPHQSTLLTQNHAHARNFNNWDHTVLEAVRVARTRVNVPIELAFGMWDKKAFEKGLEDLAAQGVCDLKVIPLFISSHSEMIDIQKFMFGLKQTNEYPIQVERLRMPLEIKKIHFGLALDDHPYVSEILAERLRELSLAPKSEGVLFVAHGPYGDFYESRWIDLLKNHALRVWTQLEQIGIQNFFSTSFFTLRDDSPAPVRNQRTAELRQAIKELNEKSITPLVIPVLLSEGGIEQGLLKRLQGLNYKIQNKFLMPHPRMIDWLVEQVPASNH